MSLPGDTDAWLKVAVGGRNQAVVDAVIARENEPLRGIGIACALLARGKNRAPSIRDLSREDLAKVREDKTRRRSSIRSSTILAGSSPGGARP